MSQYEIYKIIKELGGEATYEEIKKRAYEKFPEYTLHTYVGNRLKKLELKGYVKRIVNEDGQTIWKIIEEWKH